MRWSLIALVIAFSSGIALGRVASGPAPREEPLWVIAGELSTARAFARAVAVETGEILVFGGLDKSDDAVTVGTSELIDPATGRQTVLPQRLLGRLNQAATVAWGGRVVVTGGTEWLGGRWSPVASVDVYLPWARTWLHAAPMRQPRSDHAAAALADGRVLVAGGNHNARLLRAAEIYDPRSDTWSATDPLPRARTMFSMAALPDGSVIAAGGFQDDGKLTTTTFVYDPALDRWTAGPEMLHPRLNHSMVQLPGGDVLFVGGELDGMGTSERYVWRDRAFVHAGVLAQPRLVSQVAVLPDGRVIAVGGLPENPWRQKFDPTAHAELWDPATNRWDPLVAAPSQRAYAQLVVTEQGVYRLSGIGEDEYAYRTFEVLTWR